MSDLHGLGGSGQYQEREDQWESQWYVPYLEPGRGRSVKMPRVYQRRRVSGADGY